MADIADILDALASLSLATVYPQGTASPSISGTVVNVGQGWPPAGAVDAAMRAGQSLVSIYAVPSSTSKLPVPLGGSDDGVIAAPVHGMTATPTATGFALTGQPGVGEYATVILDGTAYSQVAGPGDTVLSVAAMLAARIPGAFASNGAVTLARFGALTVRIGAPGTIGRIIDRQRQNVILGTWAPSPSDRAVIGRALKVMVARNLVVAMPDTSQSLWIGQSENLIDKYQNELAYRRDLTVQCQWDTLDGFAAYEVTTVSVGFVPSGSFPPVPARPTGRPAISRSV